MNPYEIIVRRAEEYSKTLRSGQEKTALSQSLSVTVKDGLLNRILSCVSWLDRLPL